MEKIEQYRPELSKKVKNLRKEGKKEDAKEFLSKSRKTEDYQKSKILNEQRRNIELSINNGEVVVASINTFYKVSRLFTATDKVGRLYVISLPPDDFKFSLQIANWLEKGKIGRVKVERDWGWIKVDDKKKKITITPPQPSLEQGKMVYIAIKKSYPEYEVKFSENNRFHSVEEYDKELDSFIQNKKNEVQKNIEINNERLALIEEIRKERGPIKTKKILFIEDDEKNIEQIGVIDKHDFTGQEPGAEYILATTLQKAEPYLETADIIITDRLFPTDSESGIEDNGLNILNQYPEKTVLVTAGEVQESTPAYIDKNGNRTHGMAMAKKITIAYIDKNGELQEHIIKNTGIKNSLIWQRALDFAKGGPQALQKISGSNDIFKEYNGQSLNRFAQRFACGTPEQVEEYAYQEIANRRFDDTNEFPLVDYIRRYTLSVASTDNELVHALRMYHSSPPPKPGWVNTGFTSKISLGLTSTSDDPDPAYEKAVSSLVQAVKDVFQKFGCEVTSQYPEYELDIDPLCKKLLENPETAAKVAIFEKNLKLLVSKDKK